MAGPALPTNIDTTYADDGSDASVKLHQQYHDSIHGIVNKLDTGIGTAVAGNVLAWNGTVYVPSSIGRPYTPPSDYWKAPDNMVTSTTGVPTSGSVYTFPLDMGPQAFVVKGLGCNVTTAAVAGPATIAVTIGIYKDDGTGGFPDFTALVDSGTVDPTSTGIKYLVFGSPRTFQPGRYWVASLCYAIGTPTTAPAFTCISSALQIASPPATFPGTATNKGWVAAGQTALPTTGVTAAAYNGTAGPVVAIRAN